jgi:HEAT repeat protein
MKFVGGKQIIDQELLELLGKMYERDRSQRVRTEIVKTFALVGNEGPFVEPLIRLALRDSEPSVLQYAALGVAERRVTSAIDEIVRLLGHDARGVRLAAAQAMAALAPESKRFIPELEQALAVETDEATRATMTGTLTQLRRK